MQNLPCANQEKYTILGPKVFVHDARDFARYLLSGHRGAECCSHGNYGITTACKIMDWQTFTEETRKLGKMVSLKPDIVVAIARGGIIPAPLLAKILDGKDMFMISMQRNGAKRTITTNVTVDVSGKNILLVEDMIETGRALKAGKKFLEERGATVQTTCLYTMPISEIRPDYFLKEVPEVVIFPWNT